MANQQFDVLVEVLQSRAFVKEVESVNAQIKAKAGLYPGYEETAAALSREALKIRFTITLLQQIRTQTEPLITVTAIPD